MATPDEGSWPGVSRLPDYRDTFPRWRARDLADIIPTLEPAGVDLLARMLTYAPDRRYVRIEKIAFLGVIRH